MNKESKIIEVLSPGIYRQPITEVTAWGTQIRIHVGEDIYEKFEMMTDSKQNLIQKVCDILEMSTANFAKNFDAKKLATVAKKLSNALRDYIVEYKSYGTYYVRAISRKGEIEEHTYHRIEIITRKNK
jgi:uncharacterized protein YutD